MSESNLSVFFDGWAGLIEIGLSAPIMYLAVIASIRLSGKRSTSQMNNFDWIVTVAIGSLVGSGIILKDVTILESMAAIGLLLLCQYVTTWLVIRSDTIRDLIKPVPVLLVNNGEFCREAMRSERISEAEVRAALRENGLWKVAAAQWVTLETDATLSVIPKSDDLIISDATALAGVQGMPKAAP